MNQEAVDSGQTWLRSMPGGFIHRRQALRGVIGLGMALGVANPASAQEPGPPGGLGMWTAPRSLWLKRDGQRDALNLTYWSDGALDQHRYREACVFLRDTGFEKAILRGDKRILAAVRAGRLPDRIPIAAPISPRVLDALYAIGQWLAYFGVARPIIVTSAFRHSFYNNNMVEGASRDSYHTKARAVDIRIDGIPPERIALFARWLGVGGIGLYQSRGFLHIDDGAQRSWKGR